HGRGKMKDLIDGKVRGKMTFDLSGGFVSYAKMGIVSEADIPGSEFRIVFATDMEIERSLGNPKNLRVPERANVTTRASAGAGQVILQRTGTLTANDIQVNDSRFPPGTKMQFVPIQLEAGKNYDILLESDAFDAFLQLVDSNNKAVAQDDDSGGGPKGLDALIRYRPSVTGNYRIIVTALDGKLGPFRLTVTKH